MIDPIAHALNHPVRKRLIEALWHSSEPLSAERFHREFIHDEQVTLAMVVYHARQLDKDGIIKLGDGDAGELEGRPFVLDGPNSGEAVRRLELTGGGSDTP